MPYSIPAPAPLPLPIHSQGRPGHRRSYSDTRGPGAFAPLGLLPRRRASKAPGAATFHFRNDDPDHDDHDDSSVSDDDSDDRHIPNIPPVLRLKSPPPGAFSLSINTTPGAVPFPRSSPSPHPAPAPPQVRPGVTRTASTPIFLSNGKPLKSSLKSSSSSPSIASPTHSQHLPLPHTQPYSHLRARSAPTSPSGEDEPEPPSPTPSTHKNVHFPSKEQGGLETVRLFSRSARPASLSLSLPDDTETDTETDRDSGPGGRSTTPFPRVRSSLAPTSQRRTYAIDAARTSPVPAPALDPTANVYLESLVLQSSSSSSPPPPLALTGTLLVRNIAYEKTVAVRFTLDDWHTTSEVAAHYRASLAFLPPHIHRPGSGLESTPNEASAPAGAPGWDRFAFSIRLEDYHPSLGMRTLWLVARYAAGAAPPPGVPVDSGRAAGAGEWWDNNKGGNYRVVFCEKEATGETQKEAEGEREEAVRKRRVAVSAPSSFAAPTTTTTGTTSANAVAALQRSPSHASQLAQTTLQRLRKLNLKNYAAPASAAAAVGSPSLSSAGPDAAPTPTPPSQSSTSASSDEEEDAPLTPSPLPSSAPSGFGFGGFGFGEMVGGFPATTYPAVPGFEYDGTHMGRGRGMKSFETGMGMGMGAAFAASTSPPGMSAFGASTSPPVMSSVILRSSMGMGTDTGGVPSLGDEEQEGSGSGSGSGSEREKVLERGVGVGAGRQVNGNANANAKGGVALYWPWGTSPSSPPPPLPSSPPSSSSSEEEEPKPVPSVRVTSPASSPPHRKPPRIHTLPLHLHARAHMPRTSSPLASPRVSPLPSPSPPPQGSPVPSPRESPVPSPAHSPAQSPRGSPTHSPRGSPTHSPRGSPPPPPPPPPSRTQSLDGPGPVPRKVQRVFPPEEPVVHRNGNGATVNGEKGTVSMPAPGGRAYTLAAAPAPAPSLAGVAEADVPRALSLSAKAEEGDSVYQAFVRQWCFAGASSSSGSGSGSGSVVGRPGLDVGGGGGGVRAHSHTGVIARGELELGLGR